MAARNKNTTIIVIGMALGILLIAAGFILSPYETTLNVDNTPPEIVWVGPNSGLQTNTFHIMFNVIEQSFGDFAGSEVYERFVQLKIDGETITAPQVDVISIAMSEEPILVVRLYNYVVETGNHIIELGVSDLAGNMANKTVSFQTWSGTVQGDVFIFDSAGYEIEDGGYVSGTIYIRFVPTEGEDQIDAIKLRIFSENDLEFIGDDAGIDAVLQNELIGLTYIMPRTNDGWYEQSLDTASPALPDGKYYVYVLVVDKAGGFTTYSVLEYSATNGNSGISVLRPNNTLLIVVGAIILISFVLCYVWVKRSEARKFAYGGGYYG